MSNSESQPNHDTGPSGPKKDVEKLFERDTGAVDPEEVLRYGIAEASLDGETSLHDVLPGIGKSRTIPSIASATRMPITALTNLRENYEQYRQWGKEDGIPVQKLPTRDLCPTLRDDNPEYPQDSVAEEAREARDAGWSAGTIHQEFDVPCERGQNTCAYRDQVKDIDSNDPELFVGHFTQGHNPAYVRDRVVVIDESCFDTFSQKIQNPQEKARQYIETLDDFPFSEARRPEAGEEDDRQQALSMLEKEGLDPDEHRDAVGEFHAKAPLVAYTVFAAERMTNDIYYAELPGGRMATFSLPLHEAQLRLFDPPDFSAAESVIALDATPCLSNWRLLLGDDLKHYRLFTDKQRNQYLREQGYEFIQINSHAWPAQGGNLSIPKCEAILREVHRKHDARPDLITSKDVIDQLEKEGLGDLWREDMHFGDLRGKNDLADSELLVVLGSPSRPDGYYERVAAMHGETAERVEGTKGMNLTFGSPAADDILDSVRRGGVFQAGMRAGRTEDAEATVYIATGLVPDWLETKNVGRHTQTGGFDACISTREESDRKVIDVLQKEDGISGQEIARRANLAPSTVSDALNRLRQEGLVRKEGERRWTKWHADGVDDVNIAGFVDLDSIAEMPLKDSYKGTSAIDSPLLAQSPSPADPTDRYPAWMRDVQRRLRDQKADEVTSRAQRGRP